MPILDNPKHELFAQGLAKGLTQDDAYAEAGYTPSRSAASRLSSNVNISDRVAELQEKAAERTLVTVESISEELEAARIQASQLGMPSAMVSASLGKAKLFGLLKERHELTGKDGGPLKSEFRDYSNLSDAELNARILELTAKATRLHESNVETNGVADG